MLKGKKAKIVLEDGRVFHGFPFGAEGKAFGEVVFNTSLSGYQEIITDPSYRGQIVTMTYPLIGNYGVNNDDVESRKPFLSGFIIKELSGIMSNYRAEKSLNDYLKEHNIIGVEGVDTRALTKHIRLEGAMKAVISTDDTPLEKLKSELYASSGLLGRDLVSEVTSEKEYTWNDKGKFNVVVIDCGVKYNILRGLSKAGCKVRVVPYTATSETILNKKPDGILVSNGPGDPSAVKPVIRTLKELIGKKPVFGICLGHQMLGLALGGKTYKLKFGHHGGNQPVKDLRTGRVAITAQNHGFCVDIDSIDKDDVEVTHVNLNDMTIEGIRHKKYPVFSVQHHPEAGPGPNDARDLFMRFVDMMKKNK